MSPSVDFTLNRTSANGHVRPIFSPPKAGSTILREFLADPDKVIVCPGVYDGFTARMAIKTGFDSLYMTGAGTSISRLGMADLGLANLHEMRDNAEMIANLDRRVPLIADADTGYGGSLMVGRTTAQYIAAGVAGFHLEDQVLNKRCGHLAGKEIVSEELYLTRIRAAVNMRRKMGSDIVIIARTDALQSLGIEAAIQRVKKAIDVGADVAMVEALEDMEQVRLVCKVFGEMKVPVLYGMVQGSHSPHFSVKEAKELGIKIMIYAAACLLPQYVAVSAALRSLKETGDVSQDKTVKPKDLFDVCGMEELIEFDRASA